MIFYLITLTTHLYTVGLTLPSFLSAHLQWLVLLPQKHAYNHLDHLAQVCATLQKENLYANLKKCSFFMDSVFLGFIVSSEGVSTDPSKIQAIVDWLEPKSIHDVHSFHGLTTFDRRFIQEFNTIMSPITDWLKKGEFRWTNAATKAFEKINKNMTEALLCAFQIF